LRQTGTNFGDILPLPPAHAKSALPWRSRTAAPHSVRRKLEDREAQGGRDRAAAPEAENVVRLPREWLGPPEELVPFGPSARATEGDRDDSRRYEPADPAPDFWGEESAALQDVIETPAEPDGDPEAVGEPPPRAKTRAQRWPVRVVAATALVLCAVAGTVMLASQGSRPEARITNADPFAGSLPRAVAVAEASLTHAGATLTHAALRVAAPRPHAARQQAPAVSASRPVAVESSSASTGSGSSQTVGEGSSPSAAESAPPSQPQYSPPAEPAQPAASTNQPAHPSPLGGLACSC
jgi:hypothetical protein